MHPSAILPDLIALIRAGAAPELLSATEVLSVRSLLVVDSSAPRIMPLRNLIVSPSVQFQGATDAAATLGALGLVINAPNNTDAGNKLKAGGAGVDYISIINGSSPKGTWARLPAAGQFTANVTVVHMGQLGMTGPYQVVTSGPLSAATYDMFRGEFDPADAVRVLLIHEGPPTNFAGALGTGSARVVSIYGISSAGA